MAVVECEKCGRVFNDLYRSWNCPHRSIDPGMSVDLEPPAPTSPRSSITIAVLIAVLSVAVVLGAWIAWGWGK